MSKASLETEIRNQVLQTIIDAVNPISDILPISASELALPVVDSEGKVSERAVKIGLMNNESEEIIDGLAEGDVVILNNQDKLKEGSKVDIDTSDASDDSNAAQDGGAA